MKKSNSKPKKSSEYTFSILNNDSMLFWTKGSVQKYLSEPTEFIKKANIKESIRSNSIQKPKNIVNNILGKFGIKAMAFSNRMSGFYQYIKPISYTNIAFIVSGKLSLRNDKSKITIKAGQAYIIPCRESCYMRILANNTSMFWLDISPQSEMNMRVGKNISVQNFNSFEEIITILQLYKKEIYGKNDLHILECYASTFYNLLMREFRNNSDCKMANKVKNIIKEIRLNPALYKTSAEVAKTLSTTIYELEKISLDLFGETFSKYTLSIRMKTAINLLKYEKHSCAKIAEMVGYSSAFSFSHAFKKYFGQSPQTIRQTD